MNPYLYKCNRCRHLTHVPHCCGGKDTTKITETNLLIVNDRAYLINEIYRLLLRARVMEEALIKVKFSCENPATTKSADRLAELAEKTFDKLLEL